MYPQTSFCNLATKLAFTKEQLREFLVDLIGVSRSLGKAALTAAVESPVFFTEVLIVPTSVVIVF